MDDTRHRTSTGRNARQVQFATILEKKIDGLAIGAPSRRAIGSGVGCDPGELAFFSRLGRLGRAVDIHDPYVGVVVDVGFFGAVAHKRDPLAVGRPGRLRVVVVAEGKLRLLSGVDVQNVEMRTATIQVADVVLLELKAVDDPWRSPWRSMKTIGFHS